MIYMKDTGKRTGLQKKILTELTLSGDYAEKLEVNDSTVGKHSVVHLQDEGGDATPGTGIAFQIDAEDAVGVAHQVRSITPSLDEEEL